MCSATVAGVVVGGLLALPTGGLSVLAGASIGAGVGSAVDVATAKPPKIPKVEVPEIDTDTGEAKRAKARLIQRQISGGPGPGRKATVTRNRNFPTHVTRPPPGGTALGKPGPSGFR